MDLRDNIKNNDEYTFNKNNNIISKLLNLIVKNNLIFESDFPTTIEKQYNQLSFVKNKKIFNIVKMNKKSEKLTKIKNNNFFEKNKIVKKINLDDYHFYSFQSLYNFFYIE